MWEQYRKTIIPTQICILIACAALYYRLAVPPLGLFCFLVVMEVGAIIGAWWAARLRRRIIARRESLPLSPR